MRRAAITLATAAGLLVAGLVPAAAGPTRSDALAKGALGAQACAQHMPDRRATGQALKAAGFSPREARGGLKAYAALDMRVVVLMTYDGDVVDACSVTIRNGTQAEAEALIQPWVKMSGAKPVPVSGGPFERVWIGLFKGKPVELMVNANNDLGVMRGASIIARAAAPGRKR